mmetsp:Transcript_38002/g.68223  ORF Transcript_38002/g.68223 Transcript_38002/m.68223 type:complete len:298 (-) Transcript_38002:196-1089(-)
MTTAACKMPFSQGLSRSRSPLRSMPNRCSWCSLMISSQPQLVLSSRTMLSRRQQHCRQACRQQRRGSPWQALAQRLRHKVPCRASWGRPRASSLRQSTSSTVAALGRSMARATAFGSNFRPCSCAGQAMTCRRRCTTASHCWMLHALNVRRRGLQSMLQTKWHRRTPGCHRGLLLVFSDARDPCRSSGRRCSSFCTAGTARAAQASSSFRRGSSSTCGCTRAVHGLRRPFTKLRQCWLSTWSPRRASHMCRADSTKGQTRSWERGSHRWLLTRAAWTPHCWVITSAAHKAWRFFVHL